MSYALRVEELMVLVFRADARHEPLVLLLVTIPLYQVLDEVYDHRRVNVLVRSKVFRVHPIWVEREAAQLQAAKQDALRRVGARPLGVRDPHRRPPRAVDPAVSPRWITHSLPALAQGARRKRVEVL